MNDGWVNSVDVEKDLEVLMSKDLKLSKQCQLVKTKVNLILGIISKGVLYKSAEVISNYIEHCIYFWSPTNMKDADMLEGV